MRKKFNIPDENVFDDRSDALMHYGMPRRSGRYPWGSGENPFQHGDDFLSRYDKLKAEGKTEAQIAEAMQIRVADMAVYKRSAEHERWMNKYYTAKSMRDHGKSNREIAQEIFGDPKKESTVRSMLDNGVAENKQKPYKIADILQERIDKEGPKGMIDVGSAVEGELGVSRDVLNEAVFILQNRGYTSYGYGQKQVNNPGQQSNTLILGGPDVTSSDPYKRPGDVKPFTDYEGHPDTTSFKKIEYPASLDSKRVYIRYGNEGGKDRDGTIEIRRGVKDLDLGKDHYAQVRILVDGDKYMKGMALYTDDIPDGYDVIYNTNKTKGTPPEKVFKEAKKTDPNNPFGALIKADGQSTYIDENGNQQLSKINKLKSEGDWEEMSRNVSPQFLAKQPKRVIERQLKVTYDGYLDDFDEIKSITNPTIRQKMLFDFADDLEGAEVHLKAAAFPGQQTQVLLPLTTIGDNQVYAPNYENGTRLALVRYPHTGRFELPILTVNNNNKEGNAKITKHARDAIGISSYTAETLSGADFDGDQVVAIPVNENVPIANEKRLAGLIGFEGKDLYSTSAAQDIFNSKYSKAERETMDDATYRKLFRKATGIRLMGPADTGKEMGIISNLISDMQLQAADEEELTRAVKHSMVVIDAEKHKLDWKRSEKENDIVSLKKKYQPKEDGKYGGASSLFTKKGQDVRIPERQGSGWIDKETGEKIYKSSGRKYLDKKTGKYVEAKTKVKLANIIDDPSEISTGTIQEELYSDYFRKIRAMKNEARKIAANMKGAEYHPEAAKRYSLEVDSLKAKVAKAERNRPKERRANAMAQQYIQELVDRNPDITKKERKKQTQIALTNARAAVGASGKDVRIVVTDNEWEAIQKGAVSSAFLKKIMRYADTDDLYERALPRSGNAEIPDAKQSKIKHMIANGYTQADVAKALHVSVSTVKKYM